MNRTFFTLVAEKLIGATCQKRTKIEMRVNVGRMDLIYTSSLHVALELESNSDSDILAAVPTEQSHTVIAIPGK